MLDSYSGWEAERIEVGLVQVWVFAHRNLQISPEKMKIPADLEGSGQIFILSGRPSQRPMAEGEERSESFSH